ncbi:glycosyltransferase family 2 protein [Polymorphospora sp. NPDC051019]|uniref:glycosyltransferase n=1 Tax=Polymorphospora sp. NPDC051019 TaxID=3155725 RepID=UPI003443B022
MTTTPERNLVTTDDPLLTVVVPAYDNGHLLEMTLHSLTLQTLPRDRFEVIVVDDGSNVPVEPVVARYVDRLPLTYLANEVNRGRSVTRNRAIAAGRGEIVLFLDADQPAHPTTLERHRDFHVGRGLRPTVLLGRSLALDWGAIDALKRGETPDHRVIGDYNEDIRDYLLFAPSRRRDWKRAPWIYGHTNNASVDRATLDAVGGFDENLVTWGGEDNELFYRIFHHHGDDIDLFHLGDEAITYDLPHFRVMPMLMSQLTQNMRYLAQKHPRFDMEFFGYPGNWANAVRRIMRFEDALAACERHGLGRVDTLPAPLLAELEDRDCLLIGYGASKVRLGDGGRTFDYDAPLGEQNWHLAGVVTGLEDQRFERVVSVDLWRLFAPEELGAFLVESVRIGRRVDLVRSAATVTPADLLPLQIVDDLEFIRITIEPYFRLEVTEVEGTRTVSLLGPRG